MMEAPTAECITIDHARAIPWPSLNTHKHSRGRLAVVAGGALQTGAARLVARAGQRIGAGWVSLFGNQAACKIMAYHETSILIRPRGDRNDLASELSSFDAVIIGPSLGLDEPSHKDVEQLISAYLGILVLDADALTHLNNPSAPLRDLLKSRTYPTILTPHSGEFVSLFGEFAPSQKITATLSAAQHSNCVIVHKGASTVVASPDGMVSVCNAATPFLATAGSGDVLAGIIGGLCAQSMPVMDACKAAIWVHSEAARRIGAGLIAEDIIVTLPTILRDLYKTES